METMSEVCEPEWQFFVKRYHFIQWGLLQSFHYIKNISDDFMWSWNVKIAINFMLNSKYLTDILSEMQISLNWLSCCVNITWCQHKNCVRENKRQFVNGLTEDQNVSCPSKRETWKFQLTSSWFDCYLKTIRNEVYASGPGLNFKNCISKIFFLRF